MTSSFRGSSRWMAVRTTGAKIVVEKNGKQVKQLEGESRFEISLDFQAVYVVSFQKEGFRNEATAI